MLPSVLLILALACSLLALGLALASLIGDDPFLEDRRNG